MIGPDFLGLSFGLMIKTATTEMNSVTKAAHLTAHGKPIRGIKY